MIHLFLTCKEPFSVNFASPADTGRGVDGRIRRQSSLYEPNLPRTQALLKVPSPPCPPRHPWLNILQEPPRRLSGGESTILEQDMQNKPNLMHFSPKNHVSSKKQTQSNPIQSRFSYQKPPLKPKQTQFKPNLPLHVSGRGPCGSRRPIPPAELRNSASQKNKSRSRYTNTNPLNLDTMKKIKTNPLTKMKQNQPSQTQFQTGLRKPRQPVFSRQKTYKITPLRLKKAKKTNLLHLK